MTAGVIAGRSTSKIAQEHLEVVVEHDRATADLPSD
jgi:hypothetical protein